MYVKLINVLPNLLPFLTSILVLVVMNPFKNIQLKKLEHSKSKLEVSITKSTLIIQVLIFLTVYPLISNIYITRPVQSFMVALVFTMGIPTIINLVKKERNFRYIDTQVVAFLISTIVNLKQNKNYINAINESAETISDPVKSDIYALASHLQTTGAQELDKSFSIFYKKYPKLLVRNFFILLKVVIQRGNNEKMRPLYDEFLVDVNNTTQYKSKMYIWRRNMRSIVRFLTFGSVGLYFLFKRLLHSTVYAVIIHHPNFSNSITMYFVSLILIAVSIEIYFSKILTKD